MRRAILLHTLLLVVWTFSLPTVATASSVPDPIDRLRNHERAGLRIAKGSVKAETLGAASAEATLDNFRFLGHVSLPGRSPNGDVFLYDHGGTVGKYAYVGTWGGNCAGAGVKVINVNDPRNPRVVALAGATPKVSSEDMVVRRIRGRDILAVGLQACRGRGQGGLQLIDVTDPRHPAVLSFTPTPGGVHELDMVVRPDGRALALLAVPFVEFDNTYFGGDAGGEFRIVDVTNPANPVEVSDWGAIADSSLGVVAGNDELSSSFQGTGYYAAHYAHSVRAADDGMTAYVSYWDAGVLKFDISRPESPKLLARTRFQFDADGDAHSMTPYRSGGEHYILQNDEDFSPLAPAVVTTSATEHRYQGLEDDRFPTLLSSVGQTTGQVVDAGDGCQPRDFEGAAGKIVLADTVDPFYEGIIEGWEVPCNVAHQATRAARAGAQLFISNLVSPDDAYTYYDPGRFRPGDVRGMPVVQISDIDELAKAIRTELRGGEGVRVTLDPGQPSWGFLRVFRESRTDTNGDGIFDYRQVGKFVDLPHVAGDLNPPPGAWSIHNTEVNGRIAYSSWYANGIVALDLRDPHHPVLAGQFVPPASGRYKRVLGPTSVDVWGLAIDPETELIYASDMRSGLWIVRPTGRAAAL